MTTHGNAALATCTVGGRAYPVTVATRCRTCRSHHRQTVEALLVEGQPYTAIVQSLPEDCGLTPANIGEHYRRGHVATEHEVVRQLLDRRSRARGDEVKEQAERVISTLVFAETVVEKVFARMASGDVEPSISEGLACCRLLATWDTTRLERDRLQRLLDGANAAMTSMMAIAQAHTSPDQWCALGRELEDHPVLRAYWPPPTS